MVEARGRHGVVPNASPPAYFPLRASPFVTTHHDLGFDNGILTSVESDRPSELLRVAALPWDVAAATIAAVTQLIQLKVDYTKTDVGLITQQVELLKELKLQLEAQRALEAARMGATPPPSPPPASDH